MKHSRVYHDAIIIEISHKTTCFEVKYLQRSVFASCKEPFVVFLEFESRDIASMALKETLLIQNLARACLGDLVNFD